MFYDGFNILIIITFFFFNEMVFYSFLRENR